MCKFNPKNDSRFIDPCMEIMLLVFEWALDSKKMKIVASCCGHGKYPKTIVAKKIRNGQAIELLSGTWIPRKKRFYKKDRQGYYFIPETIDSYKNMGNIK